jgi:hypothetical protein
MKTLKGIIKKIELSKTNETVQGSFIDFIKCSGRISSGKTSPFFMFRQHAEHTRRSDYLSTVAFCTSYLDELAELRQEQLRLGREQKRAEKKAKKQSKLAKKQDKEPETPLEKMRQTRKEQREQTAKFLAGGDLKYGVWKNKKTSRK